MSSLHTSTSLSALVLALTTSSAMAATTITTDTSSPITTSTAGDTRVTTDGSIAVSSGSAITADSNATVTMNGDLTLDSSNANGATGIAVVAGTNATISIGEDATISVTEEYVPADTDANSIADGAIASASNRYGIHVLSGASTSGSITNEGTITVEGLNSGGIVVDSTYVGSIINTGTISVVGDNALGISTKAVNGNVTLEGSVYAVGAGATVLAVNGDVSGTVTVQGTAAQGASFTNDDGDTISLSRAALRTGSAAVKITGNVAGGIYVAAPPVDNDDDDDDEDNDGVDDSDEGTGIITAYGSSPALLIGGTLDTSIGGVSSNSGTYSLAIDGTVTANAYYSNTDAYGVIIGGQGGNVTLTNGIGVTGTLRATTYDQNATALLINAGSTVTSLYNSGAISATITSPGEGSTIAIQDLSGTLTSIINTGNITAGGSSTDSTVALDLSANTSGVTISQYLNAYDAETSAEYVEDNDTEDPTVYTSITGDILLGSGNDSITASSGTITGDTSFGDGDDMISLSGNTVYTGDIAFGSGTATASLAGTSTYSGTMDFASNAATLSITDTATFSGNFSNAANLAVTVSGGTLTTDEARTVSFGSLRMKSGSTLGIYIDSDTGTSSTFNVGNATLEAGTKIGATITDLGSAEGSYTVLTASSLDVQGTLDASSADLPFIYSGDVSVDSNSIILTIARKATNQLGLNRTASAAWNAVYATAQNDDSLTTSLLQIDDSATLQNQVNGLLPDHAGGVFDAVTHADRMATRHLSDDSSTFDISDFGGWFEPVFWRAAKDADGAAGYKASGWGLSAGFEQKTDLGNFGISYAWLTSKVKNNDDAGQLDLGQHDVGLFWRYAKGPLLTWARIGVSRIAVDSSRTFTGTIDDTDFTYDATGKWNGWLVSGLAGASYRFAPTSRISVKPKVELEQYWLREGGYSETADSEAIALTVASRTSNITTVTPTLTIAYSMGEISPDWRPLTFQLETGRRSVISGSLGSTTAYFNGGDSYDAGSAFTLVPDSQKGAWIGEASVLAGGYDFTWKLTGRAEKTAYATDFSARASFSVAF